MRARWPLGLFVMRKLSPPGWIATSRVSFEMSTPTLCATVDLIFSQSSSCLGGMTPGCPFRPLGKERGGQTTGQSFQIGALTSPPPPPPACVADRPAAPDPAGSDGKTIRQGAVDSPSLDGRATGRPFDRATAITERGYSTRAASLARLAIRLLRHALEKQHRAR